MSVICRNYSNCTFVNCQHRTEHEPDAYCDLYCQHLKCKVNCGNKILVDRKQKIEKLKKTNEKI